MKKCRSCLTVKPAKEFYKHAQMKDGSLNICMSCVKLRVGTHRLNNIDKIRAYDRARGNRQTAEFHLNYRREYPAKYTAKVALNNAVRDGKILKPNRCSVCMKIDRIVGHHNDYLKPLDVVWMCQGCHKQWHAKNGEAINGDVEYEYRRNKPIY